MARYIDVNQLKGHIKSDVQNVTIRTGDRSQVFCLAYQKTGYGQKRFFICPYCSKRVQRLYQTENSDWKCRKCSGVNPYYGIQNNTKGGCDEIGYRMKRIAEKNDITFTHPFNYLDFAFDKRMQKKKFRDCIRVLQAMESMRFYSLFYGVTYESKVIRAVTTGKHILLQNTMHDLKNNIYDWNTGKQIMLKNKSEVNALVKNGL